MKSRTDFKLKKDYIHYLQIHFAGLAMQSLCLSEKNMLTNGTIDRDKVTSDIAIKAKIISEEMVRQFEIR